jgi:hypothetical protein
MWWCFGALVLWCFVVFKTAILRENIKKKKKKTENGFPKYDLMFLKFRNW